MKKVKSGDDSESGDSDSSDDDVSLLLFDSILCLFLMRALCFLSQLIYNFFIHKKVTPTTQVKKSATVPQKIDSSDKSSDDEDISVSCQLPWSLGERERDFFLYAACSIV